MNKKDQQLIRAFRYQIKILPAALQRGTYDDLLRLINHTLEQMTKEARRSSRTIRAPIIYRAISQDGLLLPPVLNKKKAIENKEIYDATME